MTVKELPIDNPGLVAARGRVRPVLAALAALGLACSSEGGPAGVPIEESPAGEGDVGEQAASPNPTAEPTGDEGGPGAEDACEARASDTGASVLRRLSRREYQLTLQDLLQLPAPVDLEGIPEDTRRDGFSVFSDLQTVSAQHLRAYLQKSTALAGALMADADRRAAVLGCEPDQEGCLREFIGRFGRLAFRRSLIDEEVESLASRAEGSSADPEDAVSYVIEAMLASPSFLYRVEVGEGDAALAALSPHELSSRLSFSLWGRAPEAGLLDLAESGGLSSPADLSRTAAEMLGDARARLHFATFFREWLGFDALRAPVDPSDDWDDALMPAMQDETDRLMEEFAWGQRDFFGILGANHTWLSPELAEFHGLPVPDADGRVELPASHPRANTGVLTHSSLLSAKSDGDLIAKRGNWLRNTFLCRQLEIPAAVAEMLGELLVGLTRVEIVQKRNSEAACMGCHSTIDPIGVGFAQFDAAGRFDPEIDASVYGLETALADASDPRFDTLAELAEKLRGMPEVTECLSSKVFLYLSGREASTRDECSVDSAWQGFMTQNFDFSVLVQGIVESPEFRVRRSPEAAQEVTP